MNVNDKPMKKSYVELEKDNKELRAKIQKINQIISEWKESVEWDIEMYDTLEKITKVLEKE